LKCCRRLTRISQWEEHAEWDCAPYMDIVPGVSSQRMLVLPKTIWKRFTDRSIFLAEPPVNRSPRSSPLGNHRTPPAPASWKLKLQDASGFYRVKEKRTPVKGQLEDPLTSHCQDAGRFPAASAKRPVSNSAPTHSRLMLEYCESELDCKTRGENCKYLHTFIYPLLVE